MTVPIMACPEGHAPVPPESVIFPAVVPAQTVCPRVTAEEALIGTSPGIHDHCRIGMNPLQHAENIRWTCPAVLRLHLRVLAALQIPLRVRRTFYVAQGSD